MRLVNRCHKDHISTSFSATDGNIRAILEAKFQEVKHIERVRVKPIAFICLESFSYDQETINIKRSDCQFGQKHNFSSISNLFCIETVPPFVCDNKQVQIEVKFPADDIFGNESTKLVLISRYHFMSR